LIAHRLKGWLNASFSAFTDLVERKPSSRLITFDREGAYLLWPERRLTASFSDIAEKYVEKWKLIQLN
jgi:hypothetical protein